MGNNKLEQPVSRDILFSVLEVEFGLMIHAINSRQMPFICMLPGLEHGDAKAHATHVWSLGFALPGLGKRTGSGSGRLAIFYHKAVVQ